MLTKRKRPLFSPCGARQRRRLRLALLGASTMPKTRACVKARRRSAVLLRSMAALLHLEAGAEDRPAAPVRQIMGTASHKADDGGPEGRHDTMPTDTAEPALLRFRRRVCPGLIPATGSEQVTPQAIMAGRQGHAAEKLAIGAAFGLCGVDRCGKIRGSKKLLTAFLICPHRRQASGAFLLGHATPPHRH